MMSLMMTTDHKLRTEQLNQAIEEIQEFSLVLYAFLYKANINWTNVYPTAAVEINTRGRATFHFNPDFWDMLTIHERLFLLLHECYHVFLYHFVRFRAIDDTTNAALDVAVNHSIMRHFDFTDEQLPYLRVEGCWADTVIPGQVLLDSLSAEEYLAILQQNSIGVNYVMLDDHSTMNGASTQKVLDRIKQDMQDMFPEKTEQQIDEEMKDFKEQVSQSAGIGSVPEGELKDVVKKKKNPWIFFAKRLQKDLFKTKEESVWLPNKRLRHLERQGMFIPTTREEEVHDKVNVVLFLDTSGSCYHYKKHFIGFAKALPEEYFVPHAFGFTDEPYEMDLKNPKTHSGGTSFHFFQKVFDSIPGKKIAFVFTDGDGSPCNLENPKLWSWFMYGHGNRSYIHRRCQIYDLRDFE